MRWTLLGVGFFFLGCTQDVESDDIRTSGIYPEFVVTANGNGSSTAEARMRVGGSNSNTFLEMNGDDEIEVTADGQSKTLTRGSGFWYRTTFSTDEEDTEFVFAFLRGPQDDGAPMSVVTLPAPFSLDITEDEISRADGNVELTWDPPGDEDVDWELDGDCVFINSGSTADDGSHVISSDEVDATGTGEDESCTVTVEMERRRNGNRDPAFTEGGKVYARQIRAASFTSTP